MPFDPAVDRAQCQPDAHSNDRRHDANRERRGHRMENSPTSLPQAVPSGLADQRHLPAGRTSSSMRIRCDAPSSANSLDLRAPTSTYPDQALARRVAGAQLPCADDRNRRPLGPETLASRIAITAASSRVDGRACASRRSRARSLCQPKPCHAGLPLPPSAPR